VPLGAGREGGKRPIPAPPTRSARSIASDVPGLRFRAPACKDAARPGPDERMGSTIVSETEPEPRGDTTEMLHDGLRLHDLSLHAFTAKLRDVIVTQQSHPSGPIVRQAYERFIPPHVLWQ
jgi:hypothetical protein